MLSETLLCPNCHDTLRFNGRTRLCCADDGPFLDENILIYETPGVKEISSEIAARDRQAKGYLLHAKFPIQIFRIENFIEAQKKESTSFPILDLGCGPGPTTALLTRNRFKSVAVDFFLQSLRLNAMDNPSADALFVKADLNIIEFAPECAGGLMMADFLQHLGTHEMQKQFLHKAFKALVPGGWFFLSFFNINLKHRLSGNIEGSFSDGAIPYRRLSARDVTKMLPASIAVTKIIPMNIFHTVAADRLAAKMPFAQHLARMMVLCGKKCG